MSPLSYTKKTEVRPLGIWERCSSPISSRAVNFDPLWYHHGHVSGVIRVPAVHTGDQHVDGHVTATNVVP